MCVDLGIGDQGREEWRVVAGRDVDMATNCVVGFTKAIRGLIYRLFTGWIRMVFT